MSILRQIDDMRLAVFGPIDIQGLRHARTLNVDWS
jgi:hypothetical protein